MIRRTWWEAGFLNAADVSVVQRSQAASPALEALKSTKLTLSLARQGRQAAVELALTLVNFEGEASHPVTLFTGSWVAHLLGYPRKYRGARLIETFLGSAVRSYLLLYHFVPFCLRVRGAFFNFNSFWKILNSPASQVFIHPIALDIIWDVRLPLSVGFSFNEAKEALAAAVGEFGRGGMPGLEDEILEYEAKALVGLGAAQNRYKFSWEQVLFLPTRMNRPRRAKKARSIRKRLSKRLVRATGRRFWPA